MRHITYILRTTATLFFIMLATANLSALDKIGNVYCISTADQLNEFGQLVANGETNANGMLMNDIDFSGWTSWQPIGGRGDGNPNPYCGHFDGGGHRIMNLVVDNASKGWSSQGVFGVVTAGCVIANLIFDSSSRITGIDYVGGIVGRAVKTGSVKIVNCGNEGKVKAVGNGTTGNVGRNAGGILGCNFESCEIEITNCYNSGTVEGYMECGAITGWLAGAPSRMSGCYNSGVVKENIGDSKNFLRCDPNNLPTFSKCYYVAGSCNGGIYTGILPVASANDLIGKFGTAYEDLHPYVPSFDNGYYLLGSVRDMQWFSNIVGNYLSVNARQTEAIDLSGVENWTPIGTYENTFNGYYDGGWYAIKGINHPLFGVSYNAHFTRIAIESGTISPTVMGNNEVTTGSIVAQSWAKDVGSSTMTFCYSRATLTQDDTEYTRPDGVKAQSVDIGGLAGRYEGTMENCFFAGTINSTHTANSVGGLIGASNGENKTHLLKSYVDATINATNPYKGKFAGWFEKGGTIEYCVINNNCGITDDGKGGPWAGNSSGATLRQLANTDNYADGRMCRLLNRGGVDLDWYQTLGVDSHPVWDPSHEQVYSFSSGWAYNKIPGFTHYVGDVYSGTNEWLGSEPPSSLQYPGGGSWKTSTDDPRMNAGEHIQRVHELESDVWVFPGQEARLKPFSDFDIADRTQYYENYVRWCDYRTDRRSPRLSFSGEDVLENDYGVFGGKFLTGDRANGTYATYQSLASATEDVLDVVSLEASAVFADGNINRESPISINEPTLLFRHIFNVRNAKLRADEMTENTTKNNNYIDAHRIKLMAPKGVPFQYRLDSPESILWDDTATPTDYWYKKSDGSYGQVWHYVVETKFNGVTHETKNTGGVFASMEKGKAYTYKARGNMNMVLYMLNPQVGTYEITLYAADKNGKKIYIQGTSNPIRLMKYTLDVLPEYDGNMVTEEDLFDEGNKARFEHQWPSVMREFYGLPKTSVTFDNIDPALCIDTYDAENVLGKIYRWPRKWEESSYAFGYDKRYDYNMYVVANNALATPYHEGCSKLSQNDAAYPYKDYVMYDRLYADTKGKQQGFFYYTNAASDPGRMTVLNIGKNFCTGTEVFVSAWVKEFSATNETANVVFSFKGVDANGKETTINSFVTGYVTGGDNTKTGYGNADTGTTDNPDDRGKWMHVYYHFPADAHGYDHYVISVENNCVSSGGADYAIDNIEAFVCRPTVEARQLKPVCNGTVSTNLLLTVDFDRLLKAFSKTEATTESDGTTQTLDYCFVRKEVYQEEFNRQKAAGKTPEQADAIAFNEALVRGAYGTDDPSQPTYTYGQLTYNTHYDRNPRYNTSNESSWTKRQAMSMDPVNGLRALVFPSDANDTDMKVGSTYMISIIDHNSETPGAGEFRFYDECSKVSEFTVIFSGEVKVDGKLQSKEDGASVCANQKPVITIDLNGIGVGGELHKIENAYFDWYYGPLYATSGYDGCFTGAEYNGMLLKDALAYFRMVYYEATEADFLNTQKCPVNDKYRQEHYECIKHFLDKGVLGLYLKSNNVSTMEQFNKQFEANEKFYIVAMPFDPEPNLKYKYCLEPIQITINLNTRQPHMKDGDDQGIITYPAAMADVPLRIGLRQLWKARMEDEGTLESVKGTVVGNYVFLPLREISPVTENVKTLIEKSDDDFIYLTASDDPNVAAGKSGALRASTEASESDVRIIGRVVNITADRYDNTNNKCHLGFIKGFKFREGYSYTIKFHFQENYSGVPGDHSDVCPGDVICTIKVVPEYQKWTGAVNGDWNNDGNWERVSKADLNVTGDEWNDFVTDGGTPDNYANDNGRSFVPADFTKVIIPAEAVKTSSLYDLRTGNVLNVGFTGAPQETPFIKSLQRGEGAGYATATENINFHMSSVDIAGGNVACRTWYDHTCQQIHFKPNAEMLYQQYLDYEKAWVDIELKPWQWYTLASPLKGVVAGDMYLPSATGRQETPLFQPITYNTTDYNRFNPAVYQRGWDKAQATVYKMDGKQENVMVETTWSHVYNDVKEAYSPGNGFSIKAELPDGVPLGTKVLFRLPKDDKKYLYFNSAGDQSGNETDIVSASETRSYRLYDLTDVIVPVQTQTSGKYFLIGNPFMCHLDMAEFFFQNKQFEPKYWLMTSQGQTSAIMDEATGGFVGSATGTIPPLQGFFVELKDAGTSVQPYFTSSMMTDIGRYQPGDNSGLLDREYYWKPESGEGNGTMGTRTSSSASSVMCITATDNGKVMSQAMVCLSPGSDPGYDAAEDVQLFDVGLSAQPHVYTVSGRTAATVNVLPRVDGRIPIGVVGKGNVTALTFNGVNAMQDEWNGVMLYDDAKKDSIPLYEGMKYEVSGSLEGRLYLTRGNVGDGLYPDDIVIREDGRKVSVLSMPQDMRVEVSTTDGAVQAKAAGHSGCVTVTLPKQGVYVVRAMGESKTLCKKVILK